MTVHVGRTYKELEAYLAANPDVPVVEMDSVKGRKGGKVALHNFFLETVVSCWRF